MLEAAIFITNPSAAAKELHDVLAFMAHFILLQILLPGFRRENVIVNFMQ